MNVLVPLEKCLGVERCFIKRLSRVLSRQAETRAALGNAKARAKLVLPGQCHLRPSARIEHP